MFVLSCIIFPAADLIVSKKLLFACNIGFCVLNSLIGRRIKITRSVFLRLFFMLVIVIVFSIPTYMYYPFEVSFLIISCVTGFIIFVAYDKRNLFFKYFIVAANILAILTVIIGLLSLYSKIIGTAIGSIFLSLDSGYLGERKFGRLKMIMVHFRTAPIMIISASYFFYKTMRDFKFSSLFLLSMQIIAIVFSASRGTMLFALLSFFFILCVDYRNPVARKMLFLFVFAGILGSNYLLFQTNVFSSREESNSIKLGHIQSFFEYVGEEPTILLWGRGTGSFYYSKGFGRMTFQTEVTLLDMIRYFGVLVTFMFIFAIVLPVKKNVMNIPFILYFFDATTNPLLFCSTGFLVIALYYLLPPEDELFHSNSTNRKSRLKYALFHYNCYI